MTHPLELLRTVDDHVNWDIYEQQNCFFEDLTDDEKDSATAGVRYLRQLLGENFLRRAVETRNPIFGWFFANAAPHARRSLIRLAEELKAFEAVEGFKGLVQRLKFADKAAEALTVLSAASQFARVGFQISFDPPVPNTRKVSDLLLIDPDNGERVYVEVSRLKRSERHELNSHAYSVIQSQVLNAIWACADAANITGPHVLPYVRILRSIRREDLQELIEQIVQAIFEAARSDEYRELRIGNVVEMAVSPTHDHSQAESWAKERGMRDLVEAPPIDFSRELPRARNKIRKKMRQLPSDKPGILVIPIENLLFFIFRGEDIIAVLSEELRRHQHLLCAGFSDSLY